VNLLEDEQEFRSPTCRIPKSWRPAAGVKRRSVDEVFTYNTPNVSPDDFGPVQNIGETWWKQTNKKRR